MVSEILEEAGHRPRALRRVRRQVLEGIILLCQWQLERMDEARARLGRRPPGPQVEGRNDLRWSRMRTLIRTLDDRAPSPSCLALASPAPPRGAAEITRLRLRRDSPARPGAPATAGMLTITLFNIVHGEIEGGLAGQRARRSTSLLHGPAKAYIGPSIGRLVPYAGLGVGVYHESLAARSDTGTLGSVFAGAKLKFPLGLVVRGEYQWLNVPQPAPLKLDSRFFVAVACTSEPAADAAGGESGGAGEEVLHLRVDRLPRVLALDVGLALPAERRGRAGRSSSSRSPSANSA